MLQPHQQRRRREAMVLRVAGTHGHGRLTLMDPLFNLREITKQLLLLEDHLLHARRRCGDCIRKHLLLIEALADEAETLDTMGLYHQLCSGLAGRVQTWDETLIDGEDPRDVGQSVRRVRKQLTPLVFDPRGLHAVDRVASAHRARVSHA